MKKERMTRDEYYLAVLEAVRQRSTCDRGKSGAIIVKENRIITAGYVGAPTGMPHCDGEGHVMETRKREGESPSVHCIKTVHAELNAILQAASFGISIKWGIMFCTMTPCFECAKAIVNVGISKVVAVCPYQKQEWTIWLFERVGIHFNMIDPEGKLY